MAEIQIKYNEVYTRTTQVRQHINNDLIVAIENEYNEIQSLLDEVDSATNAKLKASMELNKQKSILVAQTLEKLLSFMSNSSKQVELQEAKMAKTVTSGAKAATAGLNKSVGGAK